MTCDNQKNNIKPLKEVISALDDLPIIARLEFARNLVCNRAGDEDDLSMDPALMVAGEVISDVIRVLRTAPRVAQLRTTPRA
jgi:hypothetical protein